MKKIIALLITTILLSMFVIPAYADNHGSIFLNASKQKYDIEDTVKVDIMITNADDLYGIELDMSFDIEYLSIQGDGIVNVAWKNGYFQSDVSGSDVRLVAAKLGDSSGIDGDAKLVTFLFTAKKYGETSVDISNIKVSNSNGELLDINSEATVTISIGKNEETDKAALDSAIAAALALKASDFTEKSWEILETVLNNALLIQSDENASQKSIDDAVEALLAATDALVEIEKPEDVDKSDLENAIKAAKDLKASDYTEKSWSKFNKALTEALLVVEDEDASQADVDAALAALVAAMDGLVEESVEDPGDEDEDSEESPKTGDEAKFLLPYVILLLLSVTTLFSILMRRKKLEEFNNTNC